MLFLGGRRKGSFVLVLVKLCPFRTGCSFLCECCRFLVWEKGLIRFPCGRPEWGEVYLSTERNYRTGFERKEHLASASHREVRISRLVFSFLLT